MATPGSPLPGVSNHRWKFFRVGGFDQVHLASGADILALDQLDQKLWFALACPGRGLEFDNRTLDLIDADHDGRVRAPEIIAAARWIGGLLKNPDDLLQGSDQVRLDAIDDSSPEGQHIIASARQILANLGKPDTASITLADTGDTARIFAQTRFNGDGIVPVEASEDEAVKAVMQDIIACIGPETDRSGKPGISRATVERFFVAAKAFMDWQGRAESDPAILPLGVATAAAAAALSAVRGKIDDYFVRCRLAAFEPRATDALNRHEMEFQDLAGQELTMQTSAIASFPLARVEAGQPLPLTDRINPAWATKLALFKTEVVQPVLGDQATLTESDWATLLDRFAPYQNWLGVKAGEAVEPLGLPRIRGIVDGNSRPAIEALIAQDKALEPEAQGIANVDKLVRYHAHLVRLLNNFVAFHDFYGGQEMAVFQIGTLYLDQRACSLCLSVDDAAKHASLASLAGAYLAYCDCTRPVTGEKRQIVAAFTNGDSDHLMVGRNGLFYDRQGRDWDATITRIVENPISLRQAFWAPYKKLVRLIEEQIAKRAAAAEAASDAKLEATASTAAAPDKAAPPAPGRKFDVGTIAAMGVALGAIGTFLVAIFTRFVELRAWQIALVILAIILLISVPSVIMAWLKLRKRSLGPILDANGWAINSRARISVPFGKSLTHIAHFPPGAERELSDPYAESKSGRNWLLALLLLIVVGCGLWYFGAFRNIAPWLPESSHLQRQSEVQVTPATEPLADAEGAPVE
jgi:hypothetical protein